MTADAFRSAPMKDGIRYDSRGEPINSEAERYRAILDDTARWLEHWGPGDTPEKVAATIRHWLDDPADFDQYAGMAVALRALAAEEPQP
jgi:hypothetical protein